MYTNYQLKTNPSFRMTKEDFNELINSITVEEIPDSKPVKVGLTIRTTESNLVAKQEDRIVQITSLKALGNGYFNVLANIQKMLLETYENINFNVIKETVLMPVGAFEDQGEITIYCVLIIKDDHLETFNTNASIKFVPIEENTLNNLDNRSIIVLPTITIVK